MTAITVCVPVNADGTIHPLLGQAHLVALCQLDDGAVTDWAEHVVGWDQTYGVDVLGVHHPRVIRFVRDNSVDTVVADDVCESMRQVLESLGVSIHAGNTGDARAAVARALVPA